MIPLISSRVPAAPPTPDPVVRAWDVRCPRTSTIIKICPRCSEALLDNARLCPACLEEIAAGGDDADPDDDDTEMDRAEAAAAIALGKLRAAYADVVPVEGE